MKLQGKFIDKEGQGYVTLLPEEPEDMWHVYNIIGVGDRIRATAVRRVQNESNTGSVTSERVRTMLTIEVEDIQFDTQACTLRLNGRNVEENQYVKMGAYHTLDLELNRKFTLTKKEWDSVSEGRVQEACDPAKTADVAAVICQEGLGYLCLITSSMTLVKAKIEVSIPRKRKGQCEQHDKGMERFFEQILQAVLRHVNFDVVKCLIFASPGFVKDGLLEYINAQAVKRELRVLMENKSKFMAVHASSGHKHSLKEVMADPQVAARLADTKAQAEVQALDRFYAMLNDDPDRAFYGYGHVTKANDQQAVEVLMIADTLFRSQDIATRKKYVNLVDSVRDNGGQVLIFSSLHVSGEQLDQLSGIAAILRFPLPNIDEEVEEEAPAPPQEHEDE
eukprot:comp22011_c0_seq1/m.31873 comp22011_c0_seq1/g.31873  ORF comp22011_c0_seq1/g.31873 comp22011_c0_seq1/m.31873 type:complete len:392 (-) comp22011_c0_seq1:150-1325(-)